jgi:hypothetical protein
MAAAKAPEGEGDAQLKADVKSLVENGWTLNTQNNPTLEKTYYFKTYTKVAVSTNPSVKTIAHPCRICTKSSRRRASQETTILE